jgi:hypothetical protein
MAGAFSDVRLFIGQNYCKQFCDRRGEKFRKKRFCDKENYKEERGAISIGLLSLLPPRLTELRK